MLRTFENATQLLFSD